MRLSRTILVFAMFAPFAFGASKEIQELQRDMALLQDQMNKMQKDFGDRLVAMQTLVQTTFDAVSRTNNLVNVMENKFNDTMKQQQQSLSGPVANVGQKLDQMSEDFRAVRESVLDMNTRMSKLDAKMADLQNLISTMQRPAAAPPGVGSTDGGTATQAAPTPPMQAADLYTNAVRDSRSGKYDIALQEFNDYLKYFPKTEFAPNAQYYIGDIYYRRNDYENAVTAFDAVLEQYSENSKTPDAHYMKGMSLLKMGKRNDAAREFRDVYTKYQDSEVAPRAKDQLKQLGLSVGPAPKGRARKN